MRICKLRNLMGLGIGLFMCFVLSGRAMGAEKESKDIIDVLKVRIEMEDGEKVVNLFSRDEELFLFLPSGTLKYEFIKPSSEDLISVEDNVLSFYDASQNETFTYGFTEMKSEKIGSIFIDLTDSDRNTLEETYKLKIPAYATIYDENGRTNISAALKFIRTRGNGTYLEVKKPYEIKFEEKQEVLGMPKAKKWVLLANFCDRSLMKDAMTYDFANENTNLVSQEGEYVDVYMNGEYLGNYYLCEKVEVKKNRVEIENQDDEKHDPEDITGGYLVNLTSEWLIQCNPDMPWFSTSRGYYYEIVSPENPTEEQKEYIRCFFNDLEDAVMAENGISPKTGKKYTDIIDIDSYVQKYLMVTTFMDPDCDYNSQYYYKNSDLIDGKLYAGPVWDFDTAIQNEMPEYQFNHFYLSEYLLNKDDVKEICINEYENTFKPFIENDLERKLSEYCKKISSSYNMDFERWKGENRIVNYGYKSLKANEENIVLKLKKRLEYMDDYFYFPDEKKYTIRFNQTEPFYIGFSEAPIGKIRHRVAEEGKVFGGWYDSETGTNLTNDLVIDRDIYAYPRTLDISQLLLSPEVLTEEYGIDLKSINPDDLYKIANVIDRMKNNE